MLIFIESGGRIRGITTYPALAYARARERSRRAWVFVRLPRDTFVFHRGVYINP